MANSSVSTLTLREVMIGGVDMSLINDGGAECAAQSSLSARLIETAIVVCVAAVEIRRALALFRASSQIDLNTKRILSSQRRTFLLVFLTLTFGIEIGFKLVNRQLIFLFNPCHIFTVMQIYFLAAKPSKSMYFLFHGHIPILMGTLLAMIFPETATRHFPLQREIYWIQHLLIYTIPAQLMPLGGPYKMQDKDDSLWWYWLSISVGMIYHWVVLQGISVSTFCNLNFMLCANPGDPFRGPYYRVAGFFYFHVLFWLHSKVYKYVAMVLMGIFGPEEEIVDKED